MQQILPVLKFLQFGRIGSKDDQASCLLCHMLKRRKTDGPKLHMLLGSGKIDTSL
jgi:hypothetical protein